MRLIDADELRDEVFYDMTHPNEIVNYYLYVIDYAPTIDAVPVVRGKWKTWEEQFPDKKVSKKNGLGVFCSICQLHADNMFTFCPNCGAKMDAKSEVEK